MQGIIIVNEVPENCDKCDLHNHCGMCLVNGGDCDYESDTRPESCPINTVDISQIADQISREHLMTITELKQKGLIKDGNTEGTSKAST